MEPPQKQTWLERRLRQALDFDLAHRGTRSTSVTHWNVCLATTKGVREHNQDRALVARIHSPLANRVICVALVADGMGGMASGGVAASVAAAAVVENMHRNAHKPLKQLLEESFKVANRRVFRLLSENGGSTLIAVAWTGSEVVLAHVGDSRAYGIQPDKTLVRLTTDHTIADQFRAMDVEASNDYELLSTRLLQFIGMKKSPSVEVKELPISLRAVLLTSDGVHDSLNPSILDYIAVHSKGLSDLTEKLITFASHSGPHDNATVVSLTGWETGPMDEDETVELVTVNRSFAFPLCPTFDPPLPTHAIPAKDIDDTKRGWDLVLEPVDTEYIKSKGKAKTKSKGKVSKKSTYPLASQASATKPCNSPDEVQGKAEEDHKAKITPVFNVSSSKASGSNKPNEYESKSNIFGVRYLPAGEPPLFKPVEGAPTAGEPSLLKPVEGAPTAEEPPLLKPVEGATTVIIRDDEGAQK